MQNIVLSVPVFPVSAHGRDFGKESVFICVVMVFTGVAIVVVGVLSHRLDSQMSDQSCASCFLKE